MRIHTFHIPVLGLAFSIDTPMRVARYGISSVISIVDDIMIERVRKQYSLRYDEPFIPIADNEEDCRARRITEYLNLVHRVIRLQVARVRASAFEKGSEIVKYFEMLADDSPYKALYRRMVQTTNPADKAALQGELRTRVVPGAIDVNIMTKLNKTNRGADRSPLPPEYSDALASLRGFARSTLRSSVVLSAGLNTRLYSYLGTLPQFLPDEHWTLEKRVTLKVSDLRSALIQGKFLAKKGVWISEFRIESGLNCGGHAFATEGLLLGPILEEFKMKREALVQELHDLYCETLNEKGLVVPSEPLQVLITVQGGIGTGSEDNFLRQHYGLDGTGWGSPFLLVPEATNVDHNTRIRLASAKQEDFYLSDASPLGIPFNNLRGSSSEEALRRRVNAGRPGSPCTKKFLVSNTEFTDDPICTASRQYQSLRIKQLNGLDLSQQEREEEIERLTAKVCLCEDLSAPAAITGEEKQAVSEPPVAVCPGPNLAFFSKIASLEEMVGHIYGRIQLLTSPDRPHVFINELRLYVDYLRNEVRKKRDQFSVREENYVNSFRSNLLDGIAYYKLLIPRLAEEAEHRREKMRAQLAELEEELLQIAMPTPVRI